jgi:H+/Cl- antiporter ClcA
MSRIAKLAAMAGILGAFCVALTIALYLQQFLLNNVDLGYLVSPALSSVAFLISFATFIVLVFLLGYYPFLIWKKRMLPQKETSKGKSYGQHTPIPR